MKKKMGLVLAALLAITSVTAGCSSSSSSGTTAPQGQQQAAPQATAEKPAVEQKIIYALSKEPEEMDPTLNVYARSSIVLQNLFRGLYKIDESGKKPVPSLAESYELDSTGTKYTFKLNKNAKWSDGKPVTAQDFEYSWKRVLNPDVASGAAFYLYYLKNGKAYNEKKASADEVGVKAVDESTLEVTLESPTPYFLELLCVTAYYPVRKDAVEKEGWTKSPETYLTTGPFVLSELKPKEKYVLKKNPNYLEADKVKLDTLEIVFIESSEAELAAYTNDEIQVSDNMTPEGMKRFENTPEFFSVPRIGMQYFDFNASKKPFDDAKVRKAFSMAINREQIIKSIVQSVEKPAFGFVPYGIPDGVQKDKEYRDVAGNMFTENVDEAKKLLAEAGYPDGQGIPEITMIVMASQSDKDIAQALQSMWKQNLGVNVNIETFESKVYWDEIENGSFNIASDGWTGDYPDPMTNLDIFESVNASDDIRWSNPEYDRLLDENRKISDQAKRMENYAKAEKILADEMPLMPLRFYEDQFLAKPNVKGVLKNYIGHTIFEYAHVE
ncbi:peptide ABC transporter substrate-binding protein [Brevibacillus centrosporus]|jgi:oligopeptide transport system substrate-binding protein|uniref:peptide ABC transporter substrate-binding protein n=1 Tax=Brevibacillus centrosporus TaxID=54910 RepID=UPI000F0A6CF4|nr:peptide ABC transporter substrate-binding protein [Brevibacillus centrosporus]MEC2132843.1 peptide ABC transporter substrate-binding protein [Brevibacillus centrosporus]RNB64286.1 peptide ABC transporter substrate-binding protein [Brevibacillus centrosporus]GED32233.1 peptide ABC transporter substrate-binding protein [Brevibacillus centrosporus]